MGLFNNIVCFRFPKLPFRKAPVIIIAWSGRGGGMWVFLGDHMVSGKTEGESFVANRVSECGTVKN